ncbi:MAG: DnaJ domain-containing protein [Candidatus Acidiferrum sp.]
MAFVEDQIAEWKAAYRVLDAPLSAPADFIKENYRTLMKRWHPDHYAAGSAEQVEAAEMTRLINEAYGKIENAPLRNYDALGGSFRAAETDGFSAVRRRPFVDRPDPFRNMERAEFWIAFGVGAMIGTVFGLGSLLRLYRYGDPGIFGALAILVVFMILFGLGSANYGDKFWDVVFRRSWWSRWW